MAITGLTGTALEPVLNAYRRTSAGLSASEIRLSSGLRLLHTGDDVASATTATKLQSHSATLRSSLQNGAHATTLLQIASNGLSQISTILDGLADLTATANSYGLTKVDYKLLDGQFQQQKAAIDGIVNSSSYHGANLLDGTFTGSGTASFQLGDVANGTVSILIPSVKSASLFSAPVSLGTHVSANTATGQVSNAQTIVNDAIAKVDAYQARLDAAEAATRSSIGGTNHAADSLLATDTTSEANHHTQDALTQHTAASLFAQALGIHTALLSLIH